MPLILKELFRASVRETERKKAHNRALFACPDLFDTDTSSLSFSPSHFFFGFLSLRIIKLYGFRSQPGFFFPRVENPPLYDPLVFFGAPSDKWLTLCLQPRPVLNTRLMDAKRDRIRARPQCSTCGGT